MSVEQPQNKEVGSSRGPETGAAIPTNTEPVGVPVATPEEEARREEIIASSQERAAEANSPIVEHQPPTETDKASLKKGGKGHSDHHGNHHGYTTKVGWGWLAIIFGVIGSSIGTLLGKTAKAIGLKAEGGGGSGGGGGGGGHDHH